MFDAEKYTDVQKTIGCANGALIVALLVVCYMFVLSPGDKAAIEGVLGKLKSALVGSIVSLALVGAVWAYLTSALIRLHDGVYEPHLVKWRASYDSDFILRSLCADYSHLIDRAAFEKAYRDRVLRDKMMSRLFYSFVGDFEKNHAGLLSHFYTNIRDYWIIVTAELYCLAGLIAFSAYGAFRDYRKSTLVSLLVLVLLAVGLRLWSKRYLDTARQFTSEQVSVILTEHKKDFEQRLEKLANEERLK
ncbi:MAG: hypothetical protein HY735_12535 [Verrucomicrobia bacterium]|nr:hypothetical protein [Verrucomicrobiota bacterium]